jgi:hypothetical protein
MIFIGLAVLTMILAIVARIFIPGKIFLGLHALSYLRVTMTMLLFSIAFHFAFNEK